MHIGLDEFEKKTFTIQTQCTRKWACRVPAEKPSKIRLKKSVKRE